MINVREEIAVRLLPALSVETSPACRISAIYGQRGSGDKIGCRTAQEHGGAGDVVGLTPSAGRRARQNEVVKLGDLLARPSRQLGIDPAGQNGIDPDVIGSPGGGQRPRELHQASFARLLCCYRCRGELRIFPANIYYVAA